MIRLQNSIQGKIIRESAGYWIRYQQSVQLRGSWRQYAENGALFFFFFFFNGAHMHTWTTRRARSQSPPLCRALYSSPRSLSAHPRSRSAAGIPYHPTSYFLSANFPMCNEWIISLKVRCWDLGISQLNSNACYHNIINISIAIPGSGLPSPFVWNVPLLWSRAISSVLWLPSCADVWKKKKKLESQFKRGKTLPLTRKEGNYNEVHINYLMQKWNAKVLERQIYK